MRRTPHVIIMRSLQEAVRCSLEAEQEAALRSVRELLEEQTMRLEKERDELQEELRSLQRDRDRSLLQAETDKQQVILTMFLGDYR